MGSERVDTVVIGAGPAGSRTAARLAGAGFRVVLLEKRDRVGHPVRCAEAAGPRALIERYLPLDDDIVSSPILGVRIVAPGGGLLEAEMGEIGLTLDRELFDARLAAIAADAGAELRTGNQAVGLLSEGGAVCGVRAVDLASSREYEIRARVVVGADGIESHSPRWAGVRGPLRPGEILSCAQELVEGIDTSRRFIEFHLGRRWAPGGYAWIFPKGEGIANAGVGVNPTMAGGVTAAEYLDRFLGHIGQAARRRRFVVGGCSVARGLRRMAVSGYVAVGEAANQNNPFSGGGIINALEGADMAADAVAGALRLGECSASALDHYSRSWNRTTGRSNEAFFHAARIFFGLTDAQMDGVVDRVARIPGIVYEGGIRPARFLAALVSARPGLLLRLARSMLTPRR